MIKKVYLTTFTLATLSAISLCHAMNNNKSELAKAMDDLKKQTQKTIDTMDRCINTIDKCNTTVERTTKNINELAETLNKQRQQNSK
jgi:archaellum component FlaC